MFMTPVIRATLFTVTLMLLAAIAIPQFAQYRQRGFDARANSDLRNAATSEEAYFATNLAYVTCADGACSVLPGFTLSGTVTVTMTAGGTAAEPAFTGTATSTSGSGVSFAWNSANGGMQ